MIANWLHTYECTQAGRTVLGHERLVLAKWVTFVSSVLNVSGSSELPRLNSRLPVCLCQWTSPFPYFSLRFHSLARSRVVSAFDVGLFRALNSRGSRCSLPEGHPLSAGGTLCTLEARSSGYFVRPSLMNRHVMGSSNRYSHILS
jgi:hypothetical protein